MIGNWVLVCDFHDTASDIIGLLDYQDKIPNMCIYQYGSGAVWLVTQKNCGWLGLWKYLHSIRSFG